MGNDKRGIFFGVVGVLTLIVAIIGASLAWFSINTQSATDRLTVQAASVQIVYEDGKELNVEKIIPSTKEIALTTFERYLKGESYTVEDPEDPEGDPISVPYKECVDDKGNTVCGVYEFTLTNNGTSNVYITASVKPSEIEQDENGKPALFQNLKYSLYDITNASALTNGKSQEEAKAIEVSEGVIDGSVTYTDFNILPTATQLQGNGGHSVYRLFIWLDEQNKAQDEEQGALFKGTVLIEVDGEDNDTLTGTLNP